MHDFTILVLPGSFAASVALTVDILAAAAATTLQVGGPVPRWRVLCVGGPEVALSNGMSIAGKSLPKSVKPDKSIWIIPGLGLSRESALKERLGRQDALQAIRAIKAHSRAGGVIAASCSSVFLLQAAGILAGKKVTTTWWLASHLRRSEPACTVDADRMVIDDGKIITAGAALAQTDLMLHLLRTRFGALLSDAVGRVMLIDARQAQAPYIVPAMLAMGNTLVAQLTAYVEEALPVMPKMAKLAEKFCISERTLARHIQSATGRSPMALLQSIRVNKARMLLESSKLSVGEIAARVGYGDATALRRLMRKTTGATPRQFRSTRILQAV